MAKVLVIDDEPDLRFLLRKLLEKGGPEVSEAPNGAVAIRSRRARDGRGHRRHGDAGDGRQELTWNV